MEKRKELLTKIAEKILSISSDNILKVAIDGVDGAGKTIFADELAEVLKLSDKQTERQIIRASVDNFHNSRALRYRLGKFSPIGFFQDSYNYEQLKAVLLDPLSVKRNRKYITSVFDYRADSELHPPEEIADIGAILIFDGIFLHRNELRNYWDFSIFLEVDFRVSVPRFAQRDNCSQDPEAESNRRYIEGQRIYLSECVPQEVATLIVDNNNWEEPFIKQRT